MRTPLGQAARNAARLGVLGGSFDPPHLGHLHAAKSARIAFALDHVVFVPAAVPPHKTGRHLAAGEERLAMLALLLEGEEGFSAWDGELTRAGPSFSVDTLRELAAELAPATRLFFILGEDNLPGFPRWREVEELVRLAQPIVVHRRAEEPDGNAVDLAGLSAFARTRLAIGRLSGKPWDATSTELRALLERGESCAELLPERLRAHLAERGLYRRP